MVVESGMIRVGSNGVVCFLVGLTLAEDGLERRGDPGSCVGTESNIILECIYFFRIVPALSWGIYLPSSPE
jgi:hypothetical protein